ncbi:MAG: extracellular solute-binding protein [Bacilli bacterium]|nr:extracellular solute-binding protein [Bacilli bacterium]
MKLINKKGICALTFMAACCGLAACGGNPTSSSQAGSQTTVTTVTWWNNYVVPDDPSLEENRNNSTYREYYYCADLIAAFQKENPNIKVETAYHGNYASIFNDAATALNTGDTPNIISCYADSVASLRNQAADSMLNVKDFADKNLATDTDFIQNYLEIEEGMYGDGMYSLPYSKSSETLVINSTVFEHVGEGKAGSDIVRDGKVTYTAPTAVATKEAYAVPNNWTQLIEVARKIKADFPTLFENQRDADGYFTSIPFVWDSAENMFISLLKNADIDYTDGTGETAAKRVLFNNSDAKSLVVQLKKWNNEGLICTQNQLPITDAARQYHQYSSNMFSEGTVFMTISSTTGSRYFAADGGFKADFNHVPAWKDDVALTDAEVISQGPSLAFFDKSEAENNAALTFYKYLTNSENSANLAYNTTYFPLRASSYENEKVKSLKTAYEAGVTTASSYGDKTKAYAGACLALNSEYAENNNYFLSPVFAESAKCRTAVGKLLTTVLNDRTATTDEEITALVETSFTNAAREVLA